MYIVVKSWIFLPVSQVPREAFRQAFSLSFQKKPLGHACAVSDDSTHVMYMLQPGARIAIKNYLE